MDLIDRTRQSIVKGNQTIIVQSPPRTGKTVTMAEIARLSTLKGNRVLFLVHRKEIIDQARSTFEKQQCDMDLVDFMMIQTAYRRVDKLPDYNLIFVDEGHHALAKTYTTVLNRYENATKLLFTATPIRTGKKQLDELADDIIVGQSIQTLIDNGNLAPFKYFSINYLDNKKLKKSNGDYTQKSMDNATDNAIYGDIVKHYRKYADGKQAVLYAYSIDSALEFTKIFNEAGISAVEVDGKTDEKARDDYVERFRNGDIKVLVNVNLFTEGIDLPNVDCVIMARPTASLSLYLQFAMRCLNPRENKEAVIIDHVGNYAKHGLPNSDRDWESAIKSGFKNNKKQENEVKILECKKCFNVFMPNEVENHCCPYCGEELKGDERQEKEIIKEAKLEEITFTTNYSALKPLSEINTYKELQAYAKAKGYKPGWVYYQAKNKGILKGSK